MARNDYLVRLGVDSCKRSDYVAKNYFKIISPQTKKA